MTLKELSKLYWLNREIEQTRRQLEELEKEISEDAERLKELRRGLDGVHSPGLDGMPHGSDVHSAVENAVMRVMRLEEDLIRKHDAAKNLYEMISARQTRAIVEKEKLENYIAEIEDPVLRAAFTCRFVDGATWEKVAESMGKYTPDVVRKMCYRYVRRND